jgi:hypothetical protein
VTIEQQRGAITGVVLRLVGTGDDDDDDADDGGGSGGGSAACEPYSLRCNALLCCSEEDCDALIFAAVQKNSLGRSLDFYRRTHVHFSLCLLFS